MLLCCFVVMLTCCFVVLLTCCYCKYRIISVIHKQINKKTNKTKNSYDGGGLRILVPVQDTRHRITQNTL